MNDWVKEIPKAVLHDHLDGGLRVSTLIELAELQEYDQLPVSYTHLTLPTILLV